MRWLNIRCIQKPNFTFNKRFWRGLKSFLSFWFFYRLGLTLTWLDRIWSWSTLCVVAWKSHSWRRMRSVLGTLEFWLCSDFMCSSSSSSELKSDSQNYWWVFFVYLKIGCNFTFNVKDLTTEDFLLIICCICSGTPISTISPIQRNHSLQPKVGVKPSSSSMHWLFRVH